MDNKNDKYRETNSSASNKADLHQGCAFFLQIWTPKEDFWILENEIN
jgi:hypothetical protein